MNSSAWHNNTRFPSHNRCSLLEKHTIAHASKQMIWSFHCHYEFDWGQFWFSNCFTSNFSSDFQIMCPIINKQTTARTRVLDLHETLDIFFFYKLNLLNLKKDPTLDSATSNFLFLGFAHIFSCLDKLFSRVVNLTPNREKYI